MDFRTLLVHVSRQISLTLPDAIALTDSLLPLFPAEPVAKFDPTNPESLGAYALTLPLVVEATKMNRKIDAIKQLRGAAKCGLAEAKNAVESKVFVGIYPDFKPRPTQDW